MSKWLDRCREGIIPPYTRKSMFVLGAILLLVLAIPLNIAFLLHKSSAVNQNLPHHHLARATIASPSPAKAPVPTATPAAPLSNLVQYVNPFIGTGVAAADLHLGPYGGANVFPGASFPHGMVQWSPDTTTDAGGYRYAHSLIHGFSLTHFSGRGCSAYQDFPFMPTVGPVNVSPAFYYAYAATFSHSSETASPGYYSVHLDPTNIQVALTVTARTGFGMVTYPQSTNAALLINAGGSATGNDGAGTGVQIIDSNEITGSTTSGHFCGKANTYTLYFAAVFDQPFAGFGTWNGSFVSPNSRISNGSESGAYLHFDTRRNPVVQVRVGISYVSIANAQLNLASENSSWNFNAVRARASAAWNEKLNQVEVSGGTASEKTVFYTALYHTLFHPNVFSDVNGQYIGFDKKVHTAKGYVQYENFPGWDMYRSLIALRALLEPGETSDMMQSLVADAQQGGGGLPRWEVANDNSGGMVGDSIDAVMATSYAFGARNFDTSSALQAMDKGASQPGTYSGLYTTREGLSDYLNLGYVSTQTTGSASITLEYATDDYCIAQFARALGNVHLYNTYLTRSQNWRNLFDATTGYIEPRAANGFFIPSSLSGFGFVEGDGMQYTWMVPYDLPGLFSAMGGNAAAITRLDTHFSVLNAGPNSYYAFMGNEPEFEVPWEYDFAGAPYRTQDVVRQIETQLFAAVPGGLPGNDDGGAMSSWYVFAAIGLYPEIPGVAGFAVGSPLFPAITLHLGNGQLLHISGQGASDSARYVQSLSINGQSYNNPWLPFDILKNGAALQYVLSSSPNRSWGNKIDLTHK